MNFTLQVGTINDCKFPICPKVPPRLETCVLGFDSSLKMPLETKLELTAEELKWFRLLLVKEYGFPAQRWIKRTTTLTPSRRRWLRALLFEAGLDNEYCWRAEPGGWWEPLHKVWHKLVTNEDQN